MVVKSELFKDIKTGAKGGAVIGGLIGYPTSLYVGSHITEFSLLPGQPHVADLPIFSGMNTFEAGLLTTVVPTVASIVVGAIAGGTIWGLAGIASRKGFNN